MKMIERKLNIIAIQERYLNIITQQINEVLGDKIAIQSTTVKNLQTTTVASQDIVVISNVQIRGLVAHLIPKECPIIVAKRDINYANTKELLNLPLGQRILVVNDNQMNTEETIQSLRETVFEHDYQAYSPEVDISKSIDYIVTPGERHLLPHELPNVIDIGPRILDISVFEELISLFEIDYSPTQIIKRYFKTCMSLSLKNSVDDEIMYHKDFYSIAQYHFEHIVANSELMKSTVHLAKRYSLEKQVRHIHIQGESGVGKGMLAQAIHNYSNRVEQSFISFNCASKDSESIEKDLFGYKENEKISYGLLEIVGTGTVCIEEIGAISLPLQERLYRIFQEESFLSPINGKLIPLQCRIITTSSKNCKELVEQELYNPNLYKLLSEYSLAVPPLSERKEDILPLIENLKQRINRKNIQFTNEVIEFFKSYHWKNNVKELYNVLTSLSLLEENPIGMEFLPFYLRSVTDGKKLEAEEEHKIISKIQEHGFLNESIEILNAFYEGKKVHTSYGRKALKKYLEIQGLHLTEQQLRMRMEVLQKMELTIVRQGRAGTTISQKGENFLTNYLKTKTIS